MIFLTNQLYIVLRCIVFILLFRLLHYTYRWFPNIITRTFCATNESFYQHQKNAYFSYLLLCGFEILLFNQEIENLNTFIYTHLFSAILIPGVIFLLWFIGPALIGPFKTIRKDIIYAITITFIVIWVISQISLVILQLEFSLGFQIIILILNAISILEFTIFTSKLPWHDVFATPSENNSDI